MRLLPLLRPLFLASLLFLQGVLEAEPLTILQRANGLPPTPPYMWENLCTGNIEGAIPHLIDHIAGTLMLTATWIDSPESISQNYKESTAARKNMLESGAIDLVLSAKNEFSSPHWITSTTALSTVMIEALVIADIAEMTPTSLNPLRGGMATNDNPYYQQLQERFQGLRTLDKYSTIIQMLEDRELDYIIVGMYQANLIKRKIKAPLKRINLVSQTIHLTAKQSPEKVELMSKIDIAINQARESGYLDYIHKNYFSVWLKTPEECK